MTKATQKKIKRRRSHDILQMIGFFLLVFNSPLVRSVAFFFLIFSKEVKDIVVVPPLK